MMFDDNGYLRLRNRNRNTAVTKKKSSGSVLGEVMQMEAKLKENIARLNELRNMIDGDKLVTGLKEFSTDLGDFIFTDESIFDDTKKMTDMCNCKRKKTNSILIGDYTNVYQGIKKLITQILNQ